MCNVTVWRHAGFIFWWVVPLCLNLPTPPPLEVLIFFTPQGSCQKILPELTSPTIAVILADAAVIMLHWLYVAKVKSSMRTTIKTASDHRFTASKKEFHASFSEYCVKTLDFVLKSHLLILYANIPNVKSVAHCNKTTEISHQAVQFPPVLQGALESFGSLFWF